MLTAVQVKALAARDGRHFVGDGSGLCLLVRGGRDGAKEARWVQRLRVSGKRREIGHGSYPRVSLAQARDKARKAMEAVEAGRDPLAEKREKKAAMVAAASAAEKETFAAALDAYIGAHGAAWRSPKTAREVRSRLERHGKALMKKPVREVGKADVLAVLRPIWTAKPVLAQQIRARIEGILEWARAAGWRDGENPAAWRGGLKPLLAEPSKVTRNRHHPALPWEQVPAFLAALRQVDGLAARCLELVIFTAVRSGEARGARRAEFDLNAAVWTIPAGRMKAGKPHRVPLPAPAVALLRGTLPEKGEALVFPSPRGCIYSDMSLLAVVKRMDAARTKAAGVGWRDEHGERVTPHGFRSSFRQWCGDTGQPREIAEHALAHAVGSETERAYARSDLFARRVRLMNEWAAWCEGQQQEKSAPAARAAA